MDTDLSNETDETLDNALRLFYREHAAATEAKDSTAQAEAHWAVMAILAEQSRRLDEWIDGKRKACDAKP